MDPQSLCPKASVNRNPGPVRRFSVPKLPHGSAPPGGMAEFPVLGFYQGYLKLPGLELIYIYICRCFQLSSLVKYLPASLGRVLMRSL